VTLVEAAAIASVLGIVLAVVIPTFVRELRTSKVEEASEVLTLLHERTAAYYAREHGALSHCLPEPAGPAPAETSVDAVEVELGAEGMPGAATWAALELELTRPLRYRYELIPLRAGCDVRVRPGESLFVLRATGDLDGDGRMSRFERVATVDEEGRVVPHGVLFVRDRME
jgi:Tfp pilus assembly protein PilE